MARILFLSLVMASAVVIWAAPTEDANAKPEMAVKPQPEPHKPALTPELPAHKPETPAQSPELPSQTAKTSDKAPETPAKAPETPTKDPETPAKDPETPAQAPETPVGAPEGTQEPEYHVTCDLLSGAGVNHSACAAHCLLKGKKGGHCNSKGVCICRD